MLSVRVLGDTARIPAVDLLAVLFDKRTSRHVSAAARGGAAVLDTAMPRPCVCYRTGILAPAPTVSVCAASGALAAPNPAGTLEPTAEARNPRKGGGGGAHRICPSGRQTGASPGVV
jgi:hypothetical protein